MKQVQIIMGTPVILEIRNSEAHEELFDEVFDYFRYVDQTFSTYKDDSEISAINSKTIGKGLMSKDMEAVFKLSEETKVLTNGYFDIVTPEGKYDPSGIVKGWSIYNASDILKKKTELKTFT